MHVNRQISYMSVPYRLRVLVLVALAVAVGFFTTTAGAASPQKHSGRIASIGPLTQAVTLEEVGRIFKVTRERVRQIEAKAVAKLQNPVRSRYLEPFVPSVTAAAA